MKIFSKQPSEVLDYDVVFSDWLTVGDNVIGATITVEAGIVFDSQVLSDDRLKIWISGGTDGTTYKVTAVMTTEDGRTKEADFKIKVKDL